MRIVYIVFLFSISFCSSVQARRSIHRPVDLLMPEIATCWLNPSTRDEKKTYFLRHYALEESALFKKYDEAFLHARKLPDELITYRNDSMRSVEGAMLKEILEEVVALLQTVKKKQNSFEHFVVLKDGNFNYKKHSGMIVLKYKQYPFVVKIFMETPESFINPFSKGFEPICFFMMGGGANRYLTGLTRIKNLEVIQEKIAADSYWNQIIDTPRKWFWHPVACRYFELTGKNIGQHAQRIILPSVYAIVVDAIEKGQSFTIFSRDDRIRGMELSHFLGARVDPHIDNFLLEPATGKIVLIDTEHFPTMVGLQEPFYFNNYGDYYVKLTWKYLKDTLGKSKMVRREVHKKVESETQHC